MVPPSIPSLLAILLLSSEARANTRAPAFIDPPRRRGAAAPAWPPASARATRLRAAPPELFELQELRAQLRTMIDRNLLQQTLPADKRRELSTYVRAVVDKAASPIDFAGRGMGMANFVAGVEGHSWRMVFATEGEGDEGGGGAAGALPYGATVILRIGEFTGTEGKLDYVLKFNERVLGLNELVARSTCRVDTGPVNPGLFTFEYEDIKTNIFGISNLPVGFFGLLKGRGTCIDTVWFDGEQWIERNYREDGDVVYSVYARDTADEEERAREARG